MSTKTQNLDSILLAVIANRLDGIVREMTNTLLRTGRSAILNTARDFSCSIVTADNQLLAAAEGLPIHIVGSQLMTKAMNRFHPDAKPGDAFLHNDPYNGNTHHADHTIMVPVFHQGEHLFTALAKAHQADCGNSQPTTYADYATDIYEEGALNFPCVRVQEDYRDVDDMIRMCKQRIRVPDQWYGDYLAALGAARVGERRLSELIARYGADTIHLFWTEWFDYSERRMIDQVRSLPAGSIIGTGSHDPVPGLADGIPLKVDIRIDPDEAMIDVDLRDNIDCVPAGYNLSEACALASVTIGVFNQLPEQIPHNEGSFRRVRVHLREGCIAGIPRHPTSCSVATTNIADRLVNITQSAFAHLGPGFGLAEGAVGQGPAFGVISGKDARRNDAPYINQLYLASAGGPGAPHEDGWLFYGIPVCAGIMYRDSVEIDELKYPILVEEIRVLPGTEGVGQYRGAPGSRVVLAPIDREVTVAYVADGQRNPPRGVCGGGDSSPHRVVHVRQDGTCEELGTVGPVTLAPGEKVVTITNGGGGYGDPLERDPERVRRDVAAGLLSVERARDTYGVAVTASAIGYAIDEVATRELRSVPDAHQSAGNTA